ncbi:hypothetical protein GP486_002038 [Trichoglossum hirsutum]|uniref:SH3 domain-containing protein n=1 Tax=Trichoglossum hirsutum TaxID=265104 RepID=A0A9P8RS49_9PEZI|nr:hypothetical protein GP486_002038 [Trichoglossum hirsutum]
MTNVGFSKDSIDLQDHDQPSAKDHSRHRLHPSPLGTGSIAPHQASALKHAAEEQNAEGQRSPRVSGEWVNGEIDRLDRPGEITGDDTKIGADARAQESQNEQAAEQVAATEDSDLADTEGDDGLDDDMMDKMSSSPSIDDGEYHLPLEWPQRVDSLTLNFSSHNSPPNSPPSLTLSDTNSSSPYVSTLIHLPLFSTSAMQRGERREEEAEKAKPSEDHHHLQGGYSGARGHCRAYGLDGAFAVETAHQPDPSFRRSCISQYRESCEVSCYGGDSKHVYDEEDSIDGLFSLEDSILDNSFDVASLSSSSSGSSAASGSWDEDNEDDDADDISFSNNPRFTDSGWGGECLREIEDIDFEFVYALHTFVATVEGQANATKGDTMVLLDDSNSYWWLVRVVKDSSIGYLPAEHIETPTERLARLNKHRNIDLSATMLGDNPEKSKNPLKKAIRRRNAKTVQFAAPTYFDASDIDYSTSEEEGEEDFPSNEEGEAVKKDTHQEGRDEITEIEPLQVKDKKSESPEPSNPPQDVKELDKKPNIENPRTSDESLDKTNDGVLKSSRIATMRNTDSFFKDDNVETRKITLTPNLLRDDSSNSTVRSNDSKELKSRGSIDAEKITTPAGQSKEDKKKKDKRPGMLSGFFKRKDRKRNPDEDGEDILNEKQSGELSRDSPNLGKTSEDSLRLEAQGQQSQVQPQQVQPLRQASKLKKQPPADHSPVADQESLQSSPEREAAPRQTKPPERPAPSSPPIAADTPEPTMRLVEPEIQQNNEHRPPQLQEKPSELARTERAKGVDQRKETHEASGVFAPIANIIKSSQSSTPKPEKVKKATTRVILDDFDSSPDTEVPPDNKNPFASNEANKPSKPETDRLSESPVQLTHADATPSQPPGLLVDTSSQEASSSPTSLPPSSPEIVDAHDHSGRKGSEDTPNSMADSVSVTPTWSDTSLRTYFEDNNDIRDLLIVVHDTSDVVPAGPDHPLIKGMFREEKTKLAEISNGQSGSHGGYFNDLGNLLGKRYDSNGKTEVLEHAIEVTEKAVKMSEADGDERARSLNTLGNLLAKLFEVTGAMEHLEQAIQNSQKAPQFYQRDLQLWPTNLTRYERIGTIDDLEEAILKTTESIQLSPFHLERMKGWTTLGNLKERKFVRYGEIRYLEEACEHSTRSLQLARPIYRETSSLSPYFNNLGNKLARLFGTTGEPAKLNEAVENAEKASQSTSETHPDCPLYLNNLSNHLQSLIHAPIIDEPREGAVSDRRETLEKAVRSAEKATALATGTLLQSHTDIVLRVPTGTWNLMLYSKLGSATTACFHRIASVRRILRLLGERHDWSKAVDIAKEAVELLSTVNAPFLSYEDQQYAVTHFSGLAADACSLLLQNGDRPYEALLILEQGRGIILRILMDLRSDISRLRKDYPELARRFDLLRAEVSTPFSETPDLGTRQALFLRRKRAAEDLAMVTETIRSLPSYAGFPLEFPEAELVDQASRGPIVIVNVTEFRSDAIIVSQLCGVQAIQLRGMKEARVKRWLQKDLTEFPREEYGEKNKLYRRFLIWLWSECVKPVIEQIKKSVTPRDGEVQVMVGWNRIENMFSYAVSSYTPTIKALGYTRASNSRHFPAHPKMLLVAMRTTPGAKSLPGVSEEVEALNDVLARSFSLELEEPNSEKKQDASDPEPVQDHLTLQKIFDMGLKTSWIAYLSACSTAENKSRHLADGVLHLASGFQVSGFRHVIASMWPASDDFCVSVAKTFYQMIEKHYWKTGISDDLVAQALDSPLEIVRDNLHKQPLAWAQFVHYGV